MNSSKCMQIFNRFRRIKRGGLFFLDEFCAVTGYPSTTAIPLLDSCEQNGIVIRYACGLYLLKPPAVTTKQHWHDWQPTRSIMQLLWDLLPADHWLPRQELAAAAQLKDTTFARYLRLLLAHRYITVKRCGQFVSYKRKTKELGEFSSWQNSINKPQKRS